MTETIQVEIDDPYAEMLAKLDDDGENDGGPCEWDAVKTHGTIPSEVPTIEVA